MSMITLKAFCLLITSAPFGGRYLSGRLREMVRGEVEADYAIAFYQGVLSDS